MHTENGGTRVFGPKRGWRYAASSMAVLLATTSFTLVGGARVAFADTLRDKSTDAFSSCIPALVPAGVGMIMHLRAMANWTGSHRVELTLARNNTEVIECGVHGGTVPGGMVNFYMVVQFIGNGITGCNVGIPGGVTCSIDPNHTVATVTQAFGPQPNSTGTATFEVNGPVVDAGSAGVITRVQVTAYSGLSDGPNSVVSSGTIFLDK
jgi:hypothetical protein